METRRRLQRNLGIMYQSGALFGSPDARERALPLDQFTTIALPENLTARMPLHQVEMGYAGR
jgi:ABC-type transporter Mla maintaining outer membrane lipid asymmetry ATPase subunit MlaF